MYLTREPMAREHLAVGKINVKNSASSCWDEGTIFMRKINNNSYDGTKHNYKLNKIRICNHRHQLPSMTNVRQLA